MTCWHFWRIRLSVADRMLCGNCLEKFWRLRDLLDDMEELERVERQIRVLERSE